MMLPYKQLVINAQTVATIPPPYSHAYKIVIDENPSYLTMSFQLNYTQRDELSEDEIYDEGFSVNDDFSWRGKLNKVWKQQLDEVLETTRFTPKPPREGDYTVEINAKGDGSAEAGFVTNRETQRWIYFIQEIRQAILESEQIEAPLALEYARVKKGEVSHVVLNGSFSERIFSVRVDQRPIEQFDWSVLQRTVNLIFNETEIDPDKGTPKRPNRDGSYLLIPGTGWLELGVGITSRYRDDEVLEKIEKTLKGFVGGAEN